MGHERIGFLPRTISWRKIVTALNGVAHGTDKEVVTLAAKTIDQVRERYLTLHRDAGVQAAFGFLVAVSRSREPTQDSRAAPDVELPCGLPPLRLTVALNEWVDAHAQSREYAEIAKRAAAETLTLWHGNQLRQTGLFAEAPEDVSKAVWVKASTGTGFSEVARSFLAKFTKRYLQYFLEREASAYISSIEARNRFSDRLHQSIDLVSQHAFETSKITQSFAAGWFNKHAREVTPNNATLSSFLRVAFSKMREELKREAAS